jgi:hypothetical protein
MRQVCGQALAGVLPRLHMAVGGETLKCVVRLVVDRDTDFLRHPYGSRTAPCTGRALVDRARSLGERLHSSAFLDSWHAAFRRRRP